MGKHESLNAVAVETFSFKWYTLQSVFAPLLDELLTYDTYNITCLGLSIARFGSDRMASTVSSGHLLFSLSDRFKAEAIFCTYL